jgi:hypothetical protein
MLAMFSPAFLRSGLVGHDPQPQALAQFVPRFCGNAGSLTIYQLA